ncbi:MAG: tRNA (adenosine(37)-N6)-threonylcarbamoyltransferase complex ATPase subunit type 1 TsaE [Spirochaetes bacterium]|nr:tRNA (adenosine(37)-N6)-threonylcarbamoyltransferase complex ATPase subunit type 1 TsaE [Spirochaetota bacterium]
MQVVEEIISKSPEETFAIGKALGLKAKRGDVFALVGDLGTGKTIFAKGIACGLGIDDEITSPTFTLLEVYDGNIPLFHFDLYRINDPRELDNLYFEEFWEGDGISIIEWAERAKARLPQHTVYIYFEHLHDTTRRIRIEYPSD